jgi:lysophospholipase L1-like esterase
VRKSGVNPIISGKLQPTLTQVLAAGVRLRLGITTTERLYESGSDRRFPPEHPMSRLFATLALLFLPITAAAAEPFFLRDGQRVVFLGDSNTFAGHFIAHLDAYLFTRFPDQQFELLNLGLPSETVSGLSEPDHPYPRPDVHTRLDRALSKTRPNVVVICYGMNDGIYYPFSEERFRKYQEGMKRLIEKAQKAGARVVVMTPPPFDPQPVKKKLLPKTAEKFSWMRPYQGYDDVLTRYSKWLLTLRDRGLMVVDAHRAVLQHLAAIRKSNPSYVLAGDGIHPSPAGHWLVAQELLRAWHAPAEVAVAEIDAGTGKITQGNVSGVSARKGTVRFVWQSRVPMPLDPRWSKEFIEGEQIGERFDHYRLKVTGLPGGGYGLFEGNTPLGKATAKELAASLDLLKFKDLSTNRQAAELWKKVAQRQRLLGLAWLTDVGHKRPDTPKGEPLAQAQKKAKILEEEIRKLAQPVKLELRISSSGK